MGVGHRSVNAYLVTVDVDDVYQVRRMLPVGQRRHEGLLHSTLRRR